MRTSSLFAMSLLVGAPAWSAQAGTISGTVLDQAGKPMRGAIVSAFDEEKKASTSVLSDSAGRFALDRLAPATYNVRGRLIGFEDAYADDVTLADGATETLKLVLEPTEDVHLQRNGASLFGEMKWESEDERISFKMSCTYCHQVGTLGFRTPEQPVDWEVMIKRMDGFGALHPRLKDTIVEQLVATYAGDATERWGTYTPPEPPKGKALAVRVSEWDMGKQRDAMIHDLEIGSDGLIYIVDMVQDAVRTLDPATGERTTYAVPEGKEPDTDARPRMGPHSIERDADGNMWITLALGGKMALFDTKTKEFTVVSGAVKGRRGGYPHTLRIDQKRTVWYTDAARGVFRLDPDKDNARTFYQLGSQKSEGGGGIGESFGLTPYGIDVAPNGHIWYTKLNGNRVGRIDPSVPDGAVKEWTPPFRGPRRLHVAPDGMVWVPGCGSGVFARFNPETEEWKVYDLPDKENQFPYALNVHPKTGDIWICGTCSDSMFRFIPSTEELIEYPMPTRVTYTREVEFAPDGSVWVCNSNYPSRHIERQVGSLIRITLDGTVREQPGKGIAKGEE